MGRCGRCNVSSHRLRVIKSHVFSELHKHNAVPVGRYCGCTSQYDSSSDVNKNKFLRPRPEQQDQDRSLQDQDQDQSDKTKTGFLYHGYSYNARTAHHQNSFLKKKLLYLTMLRV